MSILLEERADGVNEHELGQARHHRPGSRTVGIKFLENFHNGRLKPRRGACRLLLKMEERRENGQQRVGRVIRKSQAAADQARSGSIASRAKRLARVRAVAVDDIGDLRCQRVPDDVGIASWQYDVVPLRQLNRFSYTGHFEPACAESDNMERSSPGGETEPPGGVQFHGEKVSASKTDRP